MASKAACHAPRIFWTPTGVFSGTTPKVPENDLQYLKMMRSNHMLVFSGTVLGCCTRKIHVSCISLNITVVVDVFTEILIYRLRSSFIKGG